MGWLLAILVGVIFLIWLLKPSSAVKAKQEQDARLLNTLHRGLAKQPEVFAQLMKEEYPEFSSTITQSKVGELLELHTALRFGDDLRPLFQDNAGLIVQDEQFLDRSKANEYRRRVAEETSVAISPEFQAKALSDPSEYYATLGRLYKAVNRALDANPDTAFSLPRN